MRKENTTLKILFAHDGSEHSQAAIYLLSDLPVHQSSSIIVVCILPERQISERGNFENILTQAHNQLEGDGFRVDSRLIIGDPAEMIVKTAEEENPDLIVLGAIGLRATLGILLGGVAQQIVEYAKQAVLIVRAPYLGLKNVLLVTDGSERSQKTLDYLRRFPLPSSAHVKVMHVLPPLPSPEIIVRTWPMGAEAIPPLPPATLSEEFDKWEAEEKQQGQKILEQSVNSLKSVGKEATSLLKRGDAATEIIDFVKSEKIDLIISGSRGVSRFQGWLLGSVSRKLIHYAGCSILVVK
ncbi:MAG: universal stress protein [Anaerolineales bacterium]|nr:universal stress protein [Anaerolineales bacterium]